MSDKTVNVPMPNGETKPGVEVDVEESKEKWSEFTLSDGAVIKIKITLVGAVRVQGQFDPDGNPMYVVKGQPVMVVTSAPESLKKATQQ